MLPTNPQTLELVTLRKSKQLKYPQMGVLVQGQTFWKPSFKPAVK
jgi:hypothetical protein